MTEDAREGASPRARDSATEPTPPGPRQGIGPDIGTEPEARREAGEKGDGPRRPRKPRNRARSASAKAGQQADAPKASQLHRANGGATAKSGQAAGATGGQNRRGRRRGGPCIAALDLGTNNCRLLVARAESEGFFVVDAFSRVVRLGEGLAETGELSQGAMDRAVAALSICSDRLRKHRVQRFRAIATEACRRASNQRIFIDRVREETGLNLDIIKPEEEARLAVAGCAPLFDTQAEQLLVFDIGGGSTELIWVDLSKTTPQRRKSLLMALAHGASRSDRARAAAQRRAGIAKVCCDAFGKE